MSSRPISCRSTWQCRTQPTTLAPCQAASITEVLYQVANADPLAPRLLQPGAPFILEATADLTDPFPWRPLLTTNSSTMPFDFADFDVKLSDKPRKFYRVRQP